MGWILELGGAVIGAVGQHKEGQAAATQGYAEQIAAKREAEQMDIKAGQERAVATFNQERVASRVKEIISQQTVQQSQGGEDATDQTAMALRKEAVKHATLDQLMMAYEAEDTAKQLEYQAETRRKGGDLAASQGVKRAKAANLAAFGTIVGAAGKMAGDWSSGASGGGGGTGKAGGLNHGGKSP